MTAARRFVVLALPRTGSSRLVEALSQHPSVVANGEVLNPRQAEYAWAHRSGRSTGYLVWLGFTHPGPMNLSKRDIRAIGFKVLDEHVREGAVHAAALDILAGDPAVTIVHLRRHPLESLRSEVQARATRRWHQRRTGSGPPPRVTISPERCQEYLVRARVFAERVVERFRDHPRLEITYEQMETSMDQVLHRVHDRLGVPRRELGPEILVKQEARPLEQSVENYRELKAHFRRTPFASWFR